MNRLAHKVRDLRHALGLTQQALADDCGVAVGALSVLERSGQTPYAQALWRIAQPRRDGRLPARPGAGRAARAG